MKGALLVNLGSPDSTEVKDVKKYLKEFLMDERVIDEPLWLRTLLVKGIILNFRPKKSAKAYKKIWWDEGSPLIVLSYQSLSCMTLPRYLQWMVLKNNHHQFHKLVYDF